ncbi:MAG: carboxypeptidase regulatory-like domain-containing protein [Planctomycetes bacterium]|nr:carboxypeptidase regulatory-like domain-containing protein [Planctomycetota bacterium]
MPPAGGFWVLGRVVDDAGSPVPGAAVHTGRGLGFGNREFDPAAFEAMRDDPEAAMARIRAARDEGAATTTDEDGRFRLPAPPGGAGVWLRVEARGHRVLARNVGRPASGDLDAGELQLDRGAIVSGRVVDRGGRGIPGARVQREPAGVRSGWLASVDFDFPGLDDMPDLGGDRAVTDDEGRFELPHVGPGEFALRARHPDHPSTHQEGLRVAAGESLRDLRLVLEPGASIRGRVVGAPAASKGLRVAVSTRREGMPAAVPAEGPFAFLAEAGSEWMEGIGGIGERTAAVAADGGFVVAGLHPGRGYRIWVTQSARGLLGDAACSPRLEVTAPMTGVELRYDPGITVTFQVVDEQDGTPIERLWVDHGLRGGRSPEELFGMAMGRARAGNHPEGRVTIPNLRPQEQETLRLAIEAVGFRTFERKDIVLPRSGELDLGVVRLARAPVLRVQALALADRTPVAGATVRVRAAADETAPLRRGPMAMLAGRFGGGGGTQSARTDADGSCVLNAPVGPSIVVVVTSAEHAPYQSEPFVLAAAGGEHEAVLLRGGRVEVTVVGAEGAVAASERVEHVAPDGARETRSTTESGLATWERLAPGEHRFRLATGAPGAEFVAMAMDAAGGAARPPEPDWQTVVVADEAVAQLEIRKPSTAQLRGIVRENGVPLTDARIGFLAGSEADGRGEIAELMAGFGRGDGGRTARAAADGSYQLRELPAGSHRLRITSRERTMPAIVPVQLRAGENVFDIDLDVAVVRGVVRDDDGQPIAGASVRAGPVRQGDGATDPIGMAAEAMPGAMEMFAGATGGRSAKTDATGSYELRGVQAGVPLQVSVTAKGYASQASSPLTIAAGASLGGVDLRLLRAGRVKVTLAAKSPFAMAQARCLGADGAVDTSVPPVTAMLANGKGTLDGLRPGRWRVSVQRPDGEAPATQDVEVVAGTTRDVAF